MRSDMSVPHPVKSLYLKLENGNWIKKLLLLNDRQGYNHPHEKTGGNQQESPVFSHIL